MYQILLFRSEDANCHSREGRLTVRDEDTKACKLSKHVPFHFFSTSSTGIVSGIRGLRKIVERQLESIYGKGVNQFEGSDSQG